MNFFQFAAFVGDFFYVIVPRIICSRLVIGCRAFRLLFGRFFCVLNLRNRVRGGFAYWRGNVFPGHVCEKRGGGFDAQNFGGVERRLVRQAAAFLGLGIGLAGYAQRGGDFGGAGGGAVEGVKNGRHFVVSPVRRARVLVIANPCWGRYEKPLYLRQRVVDALGLLSQKIKPVAGMGVSHV